LRWLGAGVDLSALAGVSDAGHPRRRAGARESNTVGGVAVSYLKGGHTWAWVEQ